MPSTDSREVQASVEPVNPSYAEDASDPEENDESRSNEDNAQPHFFTLLPTPLSGACLWVGFLTIVLVTIFITAVTHEAQPFLPVKIAFSTILLVLLLVAVFNLFSLLSDHMRQTLREFLQLERWTYPSLMWYFLFLVVLFLGGILW
ncbi:hypothetical protein IW262DRAFT_1396086 [Armillaria fumosa]|nr:hypothetical protein IW262DRAFT_1396086 [Armillaria fumosa]